MHKIMLLIMFIILLSLSIITIVYSKKKDNFNFDIKEIKPRPPLGDLSPKIDKNIIGFCVDTSVTPNISYIIANKLIYVYETRFPTTFEDFSSIFTNKLNAHYLPIRDPSDNVTFGLFGKPELVTLYTGREGGPATPKKYVLIPTTKNNNLQARVVIAYDINLGQFRYIYTGCSGGDMLFSPLQPMNWIVNHTNYDIKDNQTGNIKLLGFPLEGSLVSYDLLEDRQGLKLNGPRNTKDYIVKADFNKDITSCKFNSPFFMTIKKENYSVPVEPFILANYKLNFTRYDSRTNSLVNDRTFYGNADQMWGTPSEITIDQKKIAQLGLDSSYELVDAYFTNYINPPPANMSRWYSIVTPIHIYLLFQKNPSNFSIPSGTDFTRYAMRRIDTIGDRA